MKNELQILIEALEKKEELLNSILDKSRQQQKIAMEQSLDAEGFDGLVDEKEELLKQMERLDEGFDAVYQSIRDELVSSQKQYSGEIAALQDKIRATMDLGTQIYTTENRTKDALSVSLARSRKELTQKKLSMRAVSNYYKASNGTQYVDSFFMDQKK